MSDSVLVLASHPDDEVLGIGGTILRHVEAGDHVHVHLASCHGLRDRDARVADAERVAAALGATLSIGWLPQLATGEREATAVAEELVTAYGPDIVYTHHPGDLNRDHRALNEAVAVTCRPYASRVRSVRLFETPSSTEWGAPAGLPAFVPNLFVRIDWRAKADVVGEYVSELRDFPHPRNLSTLADRAGYWGSVSGLGHAEAFQVVRETW